MKLKTKLILACLTITILMVNVGMIGLYTANRINDNFDVVITNTAPALIALGQIRGIFLKMETEIFSAALITTVVEAQPLLSKDARQETQREREIEEEEAEFDQAKTDLDQWIAKYDSVADHPQEHVSAQAFHQYGNSLENEKRKLTELRKQTISGEKILEEREEIEQIEKNFLGLIDQAIVRELADMEEGNQTAHQSVKRALVINLVAIISFVLLSFLIGWFLANLIASPIIQLNAAALQVAQGQLDHRVEVKSKDEVGTLANTFNYMVEQLRSLYTHLKLAREQADTANRAKSQFIAHISHELRTPLNGILGYTQILRRDQTLTEKQLQGISIIERSGEYLLTLINDILDLSKIEAGKIELSPTNFNFTQFIQSILDLFQKRIQQKGIAFNYQTLSPLPTAIAADEKRLRQILINLIGNAVKFTDRGGVTLTIGLADTFQVLTPETSPPRPALIRFQVADTGVGIAPENLERIFLPFEQVGDHSYRYEGTGLGLPITKKLVELLGGDLQVESVIGKGSRFSFALTLPEVTTAVVTESKLEEAIITGFAGPTRKILVIDDYWENRSVLVNLLMPLGFELLEASNGQEGLQQAQECLPDLIVTNLTMPVMDGLEMTRTLRQIEKFKAIPIVVATASVFEIDQQRSFEAGCNAFLPKPILINKLLQILQQQLGLTWIYAQPPESFATLPENMTTANLLAQETAILGPSPEQAATLFDLAMMGDFGGILEYVAELEQLDNQLIPFAKTIQQLAKDFKERQICEIVEPYKKTSE